MTNPKEKGKPSLRAPKPKKFGLSIPPALQLPHESLIRPLDDRPAEPTGITVVPDTTTIPDPVVIPGTTARTDTIETPQPVSMVSDPTAGTDTPVIRVDGPAGTTVIPNAILHGLLPLLSANEQLVYLRLWVLSHGFRKDRCNVGYAKLGKATGLSRMTVIRTVELLEGKKLVMRIGAEFGGSKQSRGNEYLVRLPYSTSTTVIPDTRVGTDTRVGRSKHDGEFLKTPAPPSPPPTLGGAGEQLLERITQAYGLTPARTRTLLSKLSVDDLALVPRLLERLDEQIRQRSVTNPAGLLSTWLADFDHWRPQLVRPKAFEVPTTDYRLPTTESEDRTRWRYAAARLVEQHGGRRGGYTLDRLRADMLTVWSAGGIQPDEELVEWTLAPYVDALTK